MDFAHVNSPIPGFSTKTVPQFTWFHLTQYFQLPKISVIREPHVSLAQAYPDFSLRFGAWLLDDLDFRWQEMTFSGKNHVRLRNSYYFLSIKSVLYRGPCWLKPCYPGTPVSLAQASPDFSLRFGASWMPVPLTAQLYSIWQNFTVISMNNLDLSWAEYLHELKLKLRFRIDTSLQGLTYWYR